ncbi:hypothetical protein [Amycolatopsis sp. NPDC051372]|uniref:hypothetical protein n=1 Tax=unclassified Amycolatopsis TaxID=2618356 RepID=UPI00344055ED
MASGYRSRAPNPFERLAVSGTIVEVTGNLGNSITFDLEDPEFSWPGETFVAEASPSPGQRQS